MTAANLGPSRSRNMHLKTGDINFGIVTLSFITIFVLCLIVLFYIIQVNEIVNQGYIKAAKENEIEDLIEENEKIRATIAHSKSIHNLDDDTERLNYENSDSTATKYVQVTQDVFVVGEED